MHLYKDIFGNDELLADTYPIEQLHNGMILKAKAKYITESCGISDAAIGGNKSAEEVDEGTDDQAKTVLNIVGTYKLTETCFTKKDYQTYIKDYMKRLADKMEISDDNKKDLMGFVKSVLGEFKEYQFYQGESLDPEGMIVLCKWEGEDAYFYYFRQGLVEEKC